MNVRMLQDEQAPGASMRCRSSLRRSADCRPGIVCVPFRACDSNTITACVVHDRALLSAARPVVPGEAAQRPEFSLSLSISVVIDIEYETPETLLRNRPDQARFGVDGSTGRGWS